MFISLFSKQKNPILTENHFWVISMVYKLEMGDFDLYDIYDQKSPAT